MLSTASLYNLINLTLFQGKGRYNDIIGLREQGAGF